MKYGLTVYHLVPVGPEVVPALLQDMGEKLETRDLNV